MKIQTRQDMDETLSRGCQEPGCEHNHEKMSELFINPACHPGHGVDACYNAEGIIIFTCHYCDRHIVAVKVGAEGEE
jgi:hypothetical protein